MSHELECTKCRGQTFHRFVFEWALLQDVEASKGKQGSSPKVPLRETGARLPLELSSSLRGGELSFSECSLVRMLC